MITRFNLIFILVVLSGVFAFASCVSVTGDRAVLPPSLGIVLGQDMRVVLVEAGGAADLGGVQEGDILQKLNGIDLALPNQALDVLRRANDLQPVTLVLLRENDEITLQLQPTRNKGVPGAKTPTPVPADLTHF